MPVLLTRDAKPHLGRRHQDLESGKAYCYKYCAFIVRPGYRLNLSLANDDGELIAGAFHAKDYAWWMLSTDVIQFEEAPPGMAFIASVSDCFDDIVLVPHA